MEIPIFPLPVKNNDNPEDIFLVFERQKFGFNRDLLSLYSIKVAQLKHGINEIVVKNGNELNKLRELVQNSTRVRVDQHSAKDVHNLGLELEIPKFLEITIPYLLFLDFVDKAVQTLKASSKSEFHEDQQNKSRLKETAISFLAKYYTLFAYTDQFKNLTKDEWTLITSCKDIASTPKDTIFSSFRFFVRKWNDYDVSSALTSYFKPSDLSKDLVDEFYCDILPDDESRSTAVIKDLYNGAIKRPKDEVKEELLWDEIVSFFTKSNLNEDDMRMVNEISLKEHPDRQGKTSDAGDISNKNKAGGSIQVQDMTREDMKLLTPFKYQITYL